MEKYPSALRAQLIDCETSVRTRIACPGGETIVTLGFPGLAFDMRGDAYVDAERMGATLGHPVMADCRLLVMLVERDEVPAEDWSMRSARAAERSLRLAVKRRAACHRLVRPLDRWPPCSACC